MKKSRKDARLLAQLETERDELRDALSHYEENGRPNLGLGNHMADDGTAAFDQAASLALQRNQERLLEQVDKALERMDAGSYGLCERCSEKIDYARLKAIPYATLCIECQPRAER
jgi:RNA polymerase-binding protein DksA